MVKNETKSTEEVISKLTKAVAHCARSITFDNGKEFTNHTILKKEHDIATYFCDPGAPYQKGSVENSNGIIRYYFPFKVLAHTIKQKDLDYVASFVNHIPRKVLNYLTPCEVYPKDFTMKLCDVALHC
ncbi:IS30 family transposase [Candidatus Dependentiae bacterium]|nr:IS30 family transposase [Candidatus Dependentiae bacterium]